MTLAPLPARAQGCCVCTDWADIYTYHYILEDLDKDDVEVCYTMVKGNDYVQGKKETCKVGNSRIRGAQEFDLDPVCMWSPQSCGLLSYCQAVDPTSVGYIQKKTGEKLDIEIPTRKPIDFTPSVSIPGTCFKAGMPISESCPPEPVTGNKGVTAATFARYIAGLYYFIISSIGVLAVVGIMIGGFQYLMAAGSPEKISSAKTSITSAIIGLIIALTSYLLFNTINPNLVKFEKGIEALKDVEGKRVELLLASDVGACLENDKAAVPFDDFFKDEPLIFIGPVSSKKLRPEVISKLLTVMRGEFGNFLKLKGMRLQINSAYRTMAKQIELKGCYDYAFTDKDSKPEKLYCPYKCTSCQKAAEASCSAPHQTGWAVDVCLREKGDDTAIDTDKTNNASCDNLKTIQNGKLKEKSSEDLQEYLQGYMDEAGFKRYVGEWWHFELPYAAGSAHCYAKPGEYNTNEACSNNLGQDEGQGD